MDLPELNTSLMRDLLIWAAQDEEFFARADKYLSWGQWDQGIWGKELRNGVCQSSYCMAGQAVIQTGWTLDYQKDPYANSYDNLVCFTAESCGPLVHKIDEVTGDRVRDSKGKPVMVLDRSRVQSIASRAQLVLGLNEMEASWFFDGDNEICDLASMAILFADMRGVDLNLPEDLEKFRGQCKGSDLADYYAEESEEASPVSS